ncbi:hypothetical protein AB6A40_010833 [Gnathostoma spinigerum]|uniref:Uncharacterized protein n=1 Tax=Gnathostoma spinigerum TaxID=75299 RepID=A0ABD6F2B8_9BILA
MIAATSGRTDEPRIATHSYFYGFENFRSRYPELCESTCSHNEDIAVEMAAHSINNNYSSSLSQPCLPVISDGPTQILPFLYLGSQQDALNPALLEV